jgi:hypothetical protein
VVSETGGTWGTAEEVPSTATLNAGGNAGVYSVSCASVDNCAGGGYFEDGSSRARAFVVDAPGSAPTGAPLAPSQGPGSGGTVVTPAEANLHPRPVPRPIVRRLSRKKGPKSGGTKVTIIGKNLLAPKAVRFGTKVARIRKVISATKIEVVSPKAKRTGTVAVRVTTSGGTSARTKADHFRYVRVRRHSAGR